jgi:hypothetical protein
MNATFCRGLYPRKQAGAGTVIFLFFVHFRGLVNEGDHQLLKL